MSRPLRIEFPGALYLVSNRGNPGRKIFVKDGDRRQFLDLLAREIGQQRWLCHGYCLLDDEYRLLIETPEPNLGRGLGRLNAVYSQAFNRRHGQSGHLFHGRYKAIVVEKDGFLLEACRDLALAPVRAGLVKRPSQWRWGSHRAIAKGRDCPAWLFTEDILGHFAGGEKSPKKVYRKFVNETRNDASLQDRVRGQIYLGSHTFLKTMAIRARALPNTQAPANMLHPDRPSPREVIRLVGDAANVPVDAVFDRRRNRDVFNVCVYLLRRAANVPLKQVATMSGVSAARVSQIQRTIEDSGGLSSASEWARPLDRLLI